MALDSVGDYITNARILLNDTDSTQYRYTDQQMIEGVQAGVDDMRRLRPDLFLDDMDGTATVIAAAGDDLQIIDRQYRSALLYYLVGWCEFTNDEGSDKGRAGAFVTLFTARLTGSQA